MKRYCFFTVVFLLCCLPFFLLIGCEDGGKALSGEEIGETDSPPGRPGELDYYSVGGEISPDGTTVQLFKNGTMVDSAIADKGSYRFRVPAAATDYVVRACFAVNKSVGYYPRSETVRFTGGSAEIDLLLESTPIVTPRRESCTFHGQAEYRGEKVLTGDVITAEDASGTVRGVGLVQADGDYSITVHGIEDGTPVRFFINKKRVGTRSATPLFSKDSRFIVKLSEEDEEILTLPLHAGWNCITVDVIPGDTDFGTVFSDVTDTMIIARKYTSNGVVVFDPSVPARFNTLTGVETGFGYQIKMEEAGTNTVTGTAIGSSMQLTLHEGWNVIPYYGTVAQNAVDFFETIAGDLVITREYQSDGVRVYDPGIPERFNTLTTVSAPFAYQVQMMNEVLFTPPSGFNPVSYGDTSSGSISFEGETDYFSFTGTAGETIFLNIVATSDTLVPLVTLVDGSSATLATSDTGSLHYRLPSTGEFRLLIGDSSGSGTGDYEITLQRTNDPAGVTTITFGDTVTGSIDDVTGLIPYSFTAEEDDVLYVRFAVLSTDSGSFSLGARLYDSDGDSLDESTDGLLTTSVTDGDVYLFLLDPQRAGTGDFEVTLQRKNNPAGVASTSYGETENGSIDSLTGVQAYTFTGQAGEYLHVTFQDLTDTIGDFVPGIGLCASEGTDLVGSSTGILDRMLTDTDDYFLFIYDHNLAGAGTYQITVQKDAAAPTFGGIVSATALAGGEVELSWSAATDDVTASESIVYQVYHSIGSGGQNFAAGPTGTTSAGTTSYQAAGLASGSTYYFVVRAQDAAGSIDNNTIELSITADGEAPTFDGLTTAAAAAEGVVDLEWSAAADDVSSPEDIVYLVYQAESSGGHDYDTPDYTTGTGATGFKVTELTSGTTYSFVVRSRDEAGNVDTNIVEQSATTDDAAPTFDGLVSAVVNSEGTVNLSWTTASDDATPQGDIVYLVYRAESPGGHDYDTPAYTTSAGVTGFQATGLTSGTAYYFVVRSRDEAGNIDTNTVERTATADGDSPSFGGIASAGSAAGGGIDLSWSAATDDVTTQENIEYLVYRAVSSGSQSYTTPTYTTSAGATSYQATGLTSGTTYYFVMRARDEACNIDLNTVEHSATADGLVPVFSGIGSAGAAAGGGIDLSWTAATDDVTTQESLVYLIYRAESPGRQNYDTPTYTTNAGAVSYQATGLNSGTTYYFVVRARDEAGNIDTNAVEQSALTDRDAPTFSGITAADVASSGVVSLIWNAATDDVTAQGSIEYLVYRAESPGGQNFTTPTYTTGAGETSYPATGLTSGTTYYFVVRALDTTGNIDTNTVELSARADGEAPVFGGLTSAAAATGGGVDLQWTAATDDITAQGSMVCLVYRSTGSGGQNFTVPTYTAAAGTTSYRATGLTSGITYYFVVRARDEAGNTDSNTNELNATADSTVPVFGGLATAAAAGETVELSWSTATDDVTVQGNITYLVYRATASGGQNYDAPTYTTSAGETSYQAVGLTSGTTYYFVVRARDATGNTDSNTVERSATADGAAPVFAGITATAAATGGTVTLSWSPASDGITAHDSIAYLVYRAGGSGGQDYDTPTYTTSAGATSYQATGLTSGTTYYFVVRARDEAGNIDTNTAELAVTADGAAPVFGGLSSAAAVPGGAVDLGWSAAMDDVTAQGIIIYQIYRATSSGGQSYAIPTYTTGAGTTAYQVTGLSSGTRYHFVVRARDATGNVDANTVEHSVTADGTDPVFGGITFTTPAPGGEVDISWSAATDNVTSQGSIVYQIYRAETSGGQIYDAGGPTYTAGAGATTFQAADLSSGTTYYFVVRARDGSGNVDGNTVEQTVTADGEAPAFGGLVSATAVAGGGIDLEWSAATDDATTQGNSVYLVYRAQTSESYNYSSPTYVTAGGETAYQATELTSMTTYYFVVRALDEAGNIDTNTTEQSATAGMAAPTFDGLATAAAAAEGAVDLEWSAATDDLTTQENIVYLVYQAEGPGGHNFDSSAATSVAGATTYQVTGLTSDITYYYVVRARDTDGNIDDNTVELSVTADGEPPAFGGITSVTIDGDGTMTLSWSAATDDLTAQEDIVYLVYRSASSGTQDFDSPTDTTAAGAVTYQATGLDSGTTYYFVVQARDEAGNIDDNTVEDSATTPWARTYGETGKDAIQYVEETDDGGFIAAGFTGSSGAGSEDVLVQKFDRDGTVAWEKTYGGEGLERARGIEPTSDGGYIVGAFTESYGAGEGDFWVLKLDASGNVEWEKAYGGEGDEQLYSIASISTGGYVAAGYTDTYNLTSRDLWILKLDEAGDLVASRRYGGDGIDSARFIQTASGGGFLVAGETASAGQGNADCLVMKLNDDLTEDWHYAFGQGKLDIATGIQETSDGGYVFAGHLSLTENTEPDVPPITDDHDFLVVKLASDKTVQWTKSYGGDKYDKVFSARQASDGGFVFGGKGASHAAGSSDYWVIKTEADGVVEWEKTYGSSQSDNALGIRETSDGGFIIAGYTLSYGVGNLECWLVKTAGDGSCGSLDQDSSTIVTDLSSTLARTDLSSSPGTITSAVTTPVTTTATGATVEAFTSQANTQYGGTLSDDEAPAFSGISGAAPYRGVVNMVWSAATDDVTAQENIVYLIYRAESSGGQNYTSPTYTSPAGVTAYRARFLTPGTRYYFVIRARDAAGNIDTNTVQRSAVSENTPPTFEGLTTATIAGEGVVNLNWSAATDNLTPQENIKYLIYQAENSGGQDYDSADYVTDVGITSYQVSSLASGTTYYFVVRARDAAYNVESNTVERETRTDGTTPVFGGLTTAGAAAGAVVDLGWSAATDNVSPQSNLEYLIYQAESQGGQSLDTPTYTTSAGATSYQVTGLTSGTAYYFVVRSRDEVGNIDTNTTEQSVTADGAAPTFDGIAAATPNPDGAVEISWSAATDDITSQGGLVYLIYRSVSPGGQNYITPTYTTGGATTGATSYLATGLTSGTTYYFVVRSRDEVGNIDANTVEKSAIADGEVPSFGGLAAAAGQAGGGVTLSWSPAADDVTSRGNLVYLIYRAETSGDQSYTTPTYTTSAGATTYQAADLTSGTTYYFVVRSRDEVGNIDANTVEKSAIADGEGPAFGGLAEAEARVGGGVDLSWSAATDDVTAQDSITYLIYRAETSGGQNYDTPTYTTGGATGATTYQVEDLTSGVTYFFVVRARDAAGNIDANTEEESVTADGEVPAFGGLTAASAAAGMVDLSWSAATDDVTAQGNITYLVYIATSSGGQDYNFPTSTSSAGATSYQATGLTSGTTYYFVVRARDVAGNIDTNTAEMSTTADGTAPAFGGLAFASPLAGGEVDLQWSAATDAITTQGSIVYLIYQATTPGGQNYGSPTYTAGAGSSSYQVEGLTPGTTYYFVVRARDDAGNIDNNTVEMSTATDGTTPTFSGITSAAVAAAGVVTLNWNAATDDVTAQGSIVYLVFSSTTSGGQDFDSPTCTSSAGATSYQATGLNSGTTYYFVVRARDAAGNIDTNTAERNARADGLAPAFSGIIAATAAAGGGVVLNWSAAMDDVTTQGSITYLVYRAGTSGGQNYGTGPTYTTPAGATTYQATGLISGTTYYFVVRARDEAGNIDTNTVERSSAADGAAPAFSGLSSASTATAGVVSLSWTAATDDVTPPESMVYLIYLSATGGGQNYTVPTYTTSAGATSYQATGLTSGTTYYFVVRARDATGNIDTNTVEGNAQADGVAPTFGGIVSATAAADGGLDLSWNAATDDVAAQGSIAYMVYQSTTAGGQNYATPTHTTGAGATTWQATGLTSDTTYYFVVRARDAAGNIDTNTVEKSAQADGEAPVFDGLSAAAAAGDAVSLNWTAATDNITSQGSIVYLIYRAESSGDQNYTVPTYITTAGATAYQATGLTSGTTYYFVVRTRDAAGNIDTNTVEQSTIHDGLAPAFGGLTAAVPASGGTVDLSWSAATDNVTSQGNLVYLIYRAETSGGHNYSSPTFTAAAGTTIYQTSGLLSGTTYYFVVRSRDAAGNTDTNTVERSAIADGEAPTFGGLSSAEARSGGVVYLSWNAATDDVTSPRSLVYLIYRAETSDGQNYIAEPTYTTPVGATTCQATGLTSGITYYFVVRSRDATGNVDTNTVERSGTADGMAPSFDGITSAAVTAGGTVDLSWDTATDGVTPLGNITYLIYRAETSGGQNYTAPTYTTSAGITTYQAADLNSGTMYYFVVRARDDAGNIDTNTVETSATADGAAPSFGGLSSATTAGGGVVDLSWSAATDDVTSQGNIMYLIYRSPTSGGHNFTGAPSYTTSAGATTYQATGLTSGATYFFVVRARDTAGNVDSNTVEQSGTADGTAPAFNGIVAATAAAGGAIDLSWSAATDDVTAQGNIVYLIYRTESSGGQNYTGAPTDTTSAGATTYQTTGLTSGTTYYFVIRARDDTGNIDVNTVERSAAADSVSPTFGGLTSATVATGGEVDLNWSAATDGVTAQGDIVYLIYRAETSGGQNYDTPTDTTAAGATGYQAAGLTSGTTYYFVVRAQDAAGNIDTNTVERTVTADGTAPAFAGLSSAAAAAGGVVLLSWNAATDDVAAQGSITYLIYRSTTSGGQNYTTSTYTTSTGATSYQATGLNSGTTYYFVVRARDEAGNIDTNTVQQASTADGTSPAFGGFTAASAAAGGVVDMTWNVGTDAVTSPGNIVYLIYRAGTSGGQNYTTATYTTSAGETNYQATDLTSGTTYYFVVRARDEAGNISANTIEQSVTADGTAPTFGGLTEASAGVGGAVGLSWSAATDSVTSQRSLVYLIYRAETSGAQNYSSPTYTTATGAITYQATGLTSGATYYFVVRARDAAGNIDANTVEHAATADGETPVFSGLTAAAPGAGGVISLSWNAATDNVTAQGSISYLVYRTIIPEGQNYAAGPTYITGAGATSYQATGLTTGTTYYFVVRARDAAGNNDTNTMEQAAIADGEAPVFGGLTAAVPNAGGDAVDLSWSAATDNVTTQGSMVYLIYRAETPGDQNFTTDSTYTTAAGATTYQAADLTAGTRYYFVIRSRDVAGNIDGNTVERNAILDDEPPAFDGLISATVSGGGTIALGWSAADDDVSAKESLVYLIYLATTSGAQTFATPTYTTAAGATSYQAAGLSDGTSYYFVVRAMDAVGNIDTNTEEMCATTPWARTYGGTQGDVIHYVWPTTDGGYVTGGFTDIDLTEEVNENVLVQKYNPDGSIQWEKTYGGSELDHARGIQQTDDGGYIVGCYTESFGAGGKDFWVIKLDSTGDVEWEKTYGGGGDELLSSIKVIPAGGYVAAGYSTSYGGPDHDLWVIKLDAGGNLTANRRLGGDETDVVKFIQMTGDGGFLVAAQLTSAGQGNTDCWILKLNSDLTVDWQYAYGQDLLDIPMCVQETTDGGYVFGGHLSLIYATEEQHPSVLEDHDYLVVKLDADKTIEWAKSYGTDRYDKIYSIRQTADGGYVFGGKGSSHAVGNIDYWVVKTGSTGTPEWEKSFGGTNMEYVLGLDETSDGGYIVGGYTKSFGAGDMDCWLLKLAANGDCGSLDRDSGTTVTDLTSTLIRTDLSAEPGTITTGVAGNVTSTNTTCTVADFTSQVYTQHGSGTADTTAPTFGGLTAAADAGGGAVDLSWSAATDDATAQSSIVYLIYQATSSGGQSYGEATYTTDPGAISYQVTDLTTNTYYFVVRARDAAENIDTNTVERNASVDSAAPTFSGLTAAAADTGGTVTLSWSAATDDITAQGNLVYLIYRATGSGGQSYTAPTYTTGAGATSFQATGLTSGTTYYFVVRARDEAGNIDTNTVEQSAAADGEAPVFAGLTTAADAGQGAVDLSWSAATDDVTAQGNIVYLVYQSTSSEGQSYTTPDYTTGAGATSYQVTGLGTDTYYFVA